MDIKGFIQNSLLEWEGNIASVIFLPFCNFRCKYCHAGHLIKPGLLESIEKNQVLSYLKRQKDWLDGAVITGGEPTLHEYELLELIRDIKAIGLKVLVETNGSRPLWVAKLLHRQRIDAITMDVKAPLENHYYKKITCVDVNVELLKKSIRLILDSRIEHEFRITLVPGLVGIEAVKGILPELQGAQTIALQNFQPEHCLEKKMQQISPFSADELEEMRALALPFADRVILRGRDRAVLAAAH